MLTIIQAISACYEHCDVMKKLIQNKGTFPPSCPEGLFACSNGQCVRTDAKCNGVADCSDGSDEVDCKDDDIDFSGDNSGVNRGDIPK